MKTIKSYSLKLSVLPLLLLLSGALLSCSEKDDDYGNNPGGDNNNNGTNTVKIQNYSFSPSAITISAGTTVTWTNYDNVAHTVTSDEGLFDSGLINQNGTFTYTFDSIGTFDYHCTPHPSMIASVVVK